VRSHRSPLPQSSCWPIEYCLPSAGARVRRQRTVRDLLLIIPILWIIVMLPITIGGLGVQDAGYVALMALVGVSAPVAVGMSLLEHLISRAVSLPGAFLIDSMSSKPGHGPC